MVPASNLWAFVLASVVLIVIPGPSVLFVIGRSLALGRMGGLLSVVGNAIGMLPLVAAVALGVGTVVAQSVLLFTGIKVAGALYLVYLGVQAIRHRADAAAAVTGELAPRSPWRLLGEGFVVGVTNPKTIAFFVAVLRSSWTSTPAPSRCRWPRSAPRSSCSRSRATRSGRSRRAGRATGSPARRSARRIWPRRAVS